MLLFAQFPIEKPSPNISAHMSVWSFLSAVALLADHSRWRREWLAWMCIVYVHNDEFYTKNAFRVWAKMVNRRRYFFLRRVRKNVKTLLQRSLFLVGYWLIFFPKGAYFLTKLVVSCEFIFLEGNIECYWLLGLLLNWRQEHLLFMYRKTISQSSSQSRNSKKCQMREQKLK